MTDLGGTDGKALLTATNPRLDARRSDVRHDRLRSEAQIGASQNTLSPRMTAATAAAAVVLAAAVATCSGFASNGYYYSHWCGRPGALQYLTDADCAKVFPSNVDRSFTCPVSTPSDRVPPGYLPEQELYQVVVNTTALDFLGAVVQPVFVNVILIRRTPPGLVYRYLGHHHDVPAETWSSRCRGVHGV